MQSSTSKPGMVDRGICAICWCTSRKIGARRKHNFRVCIYRTVTPANGFRDGFRRLQDAATSLNVRK